MIHFTHLLKGAYNNRTIFDMQYAIELEKLLAIIVRSNPIVYNLFDLSFISICMSYS